MSTALVVVTTLLYSATSVAYWYEGKYPWSLVFAAYALANTGLLWAAVTGASK